LLTSAVGVLLLTALWVVLRRRERAVAADGGPVP